MNVSLTPQLETMIRRKVESGLYQDASEVVRDALRQMEERDQRLRWLRDQIAVADAQVARRPGGAHPKLHGSPHRGG